MTYHSDVNSKIDGLTALFDEAFDLVGLEDLESLDYEYRYLDFETKCALQYAHLKGMEIEVYTTLGTWKTVYIPRWQGTCKYRVKPTEKNVPDTINWEHVGKGWNYLRRDEDGDICFFKLAPSICFDHPCWVSSGEQICVDSDMFASYKKGNMAWDKMICNRPGF